MNITIVYNERPSDMDRHDPLLEKFIEGDEIKTIEALGLAIASNNHQVSYLKIDKNIYHNLEAKSKDIDLLFNFAEGVGMGADREAQIPMLAEILGIKHTGPGPLSAALILNKSRAKEIWKANGVRTAKWQLFTSSDDNLIKDLTFPLLVKPNSEGSGIGIKSNSIVRNTKELKTAVSMVLNNYQQPALVEEFLPGREFTVAIIDNGKDAFTLPIVEVNFEAFPKDVPRVDTFEAKFVYGATGVAEMTKTEFCPAPVTDKLAKEINQAALSAYRSIGCLDFGRVDLRMGDDGKVFVMEINHPPGLMSDENESSFFTIAGRSAGLSFSQMMGKIINAAISRLNIK